MMPNQTNDRDLTDLYYFIGTKGENLTARLKNPGGRPQAAIPDPGFLDLPGQNANRKGGNAAAQASPGLRSRMVPHVRFLSLHMLLESFPVAGPRELRS